ncbi:isoprenylcysteine carboxylmethyltransferase family protein [Terrarubrum flagellatum]|uniref:methyltransferase family protein n=1 Tax=Terrirubrum flagellatum TaxID=2895980 RepID=UPI003144FA06
MSEGRQASSNFVWPPLIYALAAVAGLALTWIWPLPFPASMSPAIDWAIRIVGGVIFVGGAWLVTMAKRGFAEAGTPVRPTQPTAALVTDGLYRFTRNPMYLAGAIMMAGLGCAFLSGWFFLLAIVAMIAVYKLAIEREERYLTEKFGYAYTAYCSRVRRWL